MAYEENLLGQLAALDDTLKMFQEHGIAPGDLSKLDFMYLAPDHASAQALGDELDDCAIEVGSVGWWSKSWVLVGITQPIEISHSVLDGWLRRMVATGWRHQCEFDGFGASMND